MKEIILTQNKVALVDAEDYERINAFHWYIGCGRRGKYYAVRSTYSNRKYKGIIMHRQILNAPVGVHVDHINGNTLDNRKENLRFCTNQQNTFNSKYPKKNNKLGIKGVCIRKGTRKFRATIFVNKKQIFLGNFYVLGDADSAYRIAEEKYFGEFARTEMQGKVW